MYYINGRFLTQKMTGIQRFAWQMCLSLVQNGVDICVIMPGSKTEKRDYPFKTIEYGTDMGPLWEQIFLPLFLFKHPDAELISFSGLGPIFAKRHISTIHDLSFFANKNWFSLPYRLYYRILTPILARKCKALITVSEFSKSEIVKYLGINPNKIVVIYNAVADTFFDKSEEGSIDARFQKPFVLAVSSLDPRKNFSMLVQAFEESDIETHKLYIIGAYHAAFSQTNLTHKSGKIEFLGHVDDNILKQAYRHASLFIYPSLYEGFGIPPLEAMASGCPVLLSDIEVFHEIDGNNALYCDPNNKEDIIKNIKFALDAKNAHFISDLKDKGFAKSRCYNWEASGLKLKMALLKND